MERFHVKIRRAMGTMNLRDRFAPRTSARRRTITRRRFMERLHVKIRRAMRTMNQQGSLGQQRKARISNHKKIQQQNIKT